MPLKIIRQDITKMTCDAIVNSTSPELCINGGAEAMLCRAGGPKLAEAMTKMGGCPVGQVRVTPAFDLGAKCVIHTSAPKWQGGTEGEAALLAKCYTGALELAEERGLQSIAFPLMGSGEMGFPTELALEIATNALGGSRQCEDMQIYLLLYDRDSYSVGRRMLSEVQAFIDDNYSEGAQWEYRRRRREISASLSYGVEACVLADDLCFEDCIEPTLDDMLRSMDRGFAETLFAYIDEKGITDVECYKRSNVDKKTFSKIKCNKDYRPSKITAVSFAIGLRLNLEQTGHLLSTAGMCLSRSSVFDVIIEYFVTTGKYSDIFEVNEVLFRFDQSLLGV